VLASRFIKIRRSICTSIKTIIEKLKNALASISRALVKFLVSFSSIGYWCLIAILLLCWLVTMAFMIFGTMLFEAIGPVFMGGKDEKTDVEDKEDDL